MLLEKYVGVFSNTILRVWSPKIIFFLILKKGKNSEFDPSSGWTLAACLTRVSHKGSCFLVHTEWNCQLTCSSKDKFAWVTSPFRVPIKPIWTSKLNTTILNTILTVQTHYNPIHTFKSYYKSLLHRHYTMHALTIHTCVHSNYNSIEFCVRNMPTKCTNNRDWVMNESWERMNTQMVDTKDFIFMTKRNR